MKNKIWGLVIVLSGVVLLNFHSNALALLTWVETTVEDFTDSVLDNVVVCDDNGGEVRLPHPMRKVVDDYKDSNIPRFVAYDSSGNYLRVRFYNDNVYVQKHASDGSVVEPEIRVNVVAGTAGHYFCHVAMMRDGVSIVTWFQKSASRDSNFLNYQVFDGEMQRIGGTRSVTEFNYNGDPSNVFANNADSSFWILQRLGNFNNGMKFYVQRIDKQGEKIGALFRLDKQNTLKDNFSPSIAVNKNDDFVVAWTGGIKSSSDYLDVYIKRYDQHGNPLDGPIKVNDDVLRTTQEAAAVCFDDDLNFLVVWVDWRDNKNEAGPYDTNIYGQFFDSSGKKVSSNFRVNVPRNNSDSNPWVNFKDNDFEISWGSLYLEQGVNKTWVTRYKYLPVNFGTLTSSIFDAGPGGAGFDQIIWHAALPPETGIYFKIRTAFSLADIQQMLWYGPTDTSDFYDVSPKDINPIHQGDRYIQYKAFLNTSIIGKSPALNSVSISYSPADSVAPALPMNFGAQPAHSAVVLAWTPSPDSDIAQYCLYRGDKSGEYDAGWTKQLPASVESYIDTSAITGVKYYYALSAIDSSHNESDLTPPVFATPFGVNIYVDQASEGGDGSVLSPYLTIEEGLASAVYGDTVIVLPGTYNEVLEMKKGISLIGSGAEATRIDGTEGGIHYTIKGADNAVLRGFTIVNDNLSSSAGVRCDSASMLITGNVILTKDMGIALQRSSPYIIGNYIESRDLGILVYLRSQAVIKNNVLRCRWAIDASHRTQSTILNNVFLFKNRAIDLNRASIADIRNNIFYGLGEEAWGIKCSESVATISYTDFYNVSEKYLTSDLGVINQGEGVFQVDPLFVNMAKGDYRLRLDSPCIDAGDPDPELVDVDGTRNDLGVFGGPSPMDATLTTTFARSVSITSVSGFPGDTVHTFINVDNPAGVAKADFLVSFDSSMLKAEPVRLTRTTKDFMLSQDISHVGEIKVSIQREAEVDSGDGKFLELSYVVKKNLFSGQACPIELKLVALFDGDGNSIDINSISNGAFIVNLGSEDGCYVYVDSKKNVDGDGSRERPFNKIQEAIDFASQGDTIVVASGEYHEQPVIRKEVYLRGAGALATFIIVEPDHDAVWFVGVQKGEISGFTIKSSSEGYSLGTAISCKASSPLITRNRLEYESGDMGISCEDNSNPIIEKNAVVNAGIVMSASKPIIRNNFIRPSFMNGIFCFDSSFLQIINNRISSATGVGAAIAIVENSGALLKNNVIINPGDQGGVYLNNASDIEMRNCIIIDKLGNGVGIDVGNSTNVRVLNNTIVTRRRGVMERNSSTIIENNIIVGAAEFGVSVSEASALSFNDVWGNGTDYYNCSPGENDISGDPLFVNASINNFHLAAGSPCIDTGNPAAEYNDPDGSRNDMGAYGGPYGGADWLMSAGACLSVSSTKAAYQDTIRVPILGSSIAGVADIDLLLNYDARPLSFLTAATTDITNSFSLTIIKVAENMIKLSLSAPTGIKANSGAIVTLVFAVRASSDVNSFIRFSRAHLRDHVAVDRFVSALSNGNVVITKTGVHSQDEKTLSFHLYQNYPNPFNTSTTVKYSIPINGHVSVKIYNVLGRKVRTLVDRWQVAGLHRILWDGKDDLGVQTASGVYFYKIHFGEFVQIRKLLLVR